jgi:hypothetical protein
MQKQREPGQYWVRFRDFPSKWIVASWKDNAWEIPTLQAKYGDVMMREIDETPLTRDTKTEPSPGYEEISAYYHSSEDLGHPQTWPVADMIAKSANLNAKVISNLAIQVERIANALENQNQLSKLEKEMEPFQEGYDLAKKLSGNQEQEGVTGPALDLAKSLVESWNKPKFKQYSWNKELIDLRLLWEHCGNREKFLDTILEKLNAPNSVFGEIKPVIHLPKLWIECENNQDKFMAKLRELGLQDSVFGQVKPLAEVEGEPSRYDTRAEKMAIHHIEHSDYKGDLGAVQKQNPTTWQKWQFILLSGGYHVTDCTYPIYEVSRNSVSVIYRIWLPTGDTVNKHWFDAYNVQLMGNAIQPVFGPDFPKPDWWDEGSNNSHVIG